MRVEEMGPDADEVFTTGSAEEKDAFLADHQSQQSRDYWRAFRLASDRQRSAAEERFAAEVARIRTAIAAETLATADAVREAVYASETARLGRSLSMSETHVCRAVSLALVAEMNSRAECTDDATALHCVNLKHCQGCDHCQATTRERIAIRRDDGQADDVRWCDDCAAIVAADLHDFYRGEQQPSKAVA